MQKTKCKKQDINSKNFLNRKETFRFNRYHNEKHTVRMVHRGIHLPDMVSLIGGEKMEKVTLSVQELANCLGISLPKAYQLTHQPGFPVVRIGNRRLIPTKEFSEWLATMSEEGCSNEQNNK
jgi:excisionase family DNA binding protein